jgi:hypothetical protein
MRHIKGGKCLVSKKKESPCLKNKNVLGMVIHRCNPSNLEGRRIEVQGWPGQKYKTLSENKQTNKQTKKPEGQGEWLKW